MTSPTGIPCYEVKWKIHNFSCCWQEELVSPCFHINSLQNTRWSLRLYPRGTSRTYGDSIALYLLSENDEEEKSEILTYELAVLDNDNSLFHTKTTESFSIRKGRKYITTLFIQHSKILQNKKNVLLRDVLNIRCRIWRDGKRSLTTFFRWLTTNIEVNRCHFSWTINFYECLHKEIKETLHFKPYFSNIVTVEPLSFIISYFIQDKHSCIKIVIDGLIESVCSWKCNIRIAGTQELFFCGNGIIKKEGLPYKRKFKPLITRETILERKEHFLKNKYLILDCCVVMIPHRRFEFSCETDRGKIVDADSYLEIADCEPATTIWNTMIDDEIFEITNSKSEEFDSDVDSLAGDLEGLLQSGHFSDFTLKVQQETFAVHSAILAARSPVFRQMLESDMRGKSNGITEIEDFDVETVIMMLNFLYTNHPGHLTVENAMKLYYAGDRYQVFSLKVICSNFLQRHFSIENVCDIVELSDRHNDEKLLFKAVEFINEFKKEIVFSEAFKKFRERNAKCAVKVYSILTELMMLK